MKWAIVLNGCSSAFPSRAKELCAFAANTFGEPINAATIIIHDERGDSRELLAHTFTRRVILLKTAGGHPETALQILPEYCREYDLILFPGDYFGEEAAVRLAARLGGASLVAAEKLRAENGRIFCEKKVYSQHLTAAFELRKSPACISIARGLGETLFTPHPQPAILKADHSHIKPAFIIASHLKTPDTTDDLGTARRLVVAGKGIGGPELLEPLGEFAAAINASWGVTRPMAMNAWAPLNKLVGVSGAMTRPELCLTFGVSGAPALYAGIEKSPFIISINRDPQAPIIRQSDVAVIGDCAALLEELQKIQKI